MLGIGLFGVGNAADEITTIETPLALNRQGMLTTAQFPRDAWDVYVYYSAVVEDGNYRMLYTAYSDATTLGPAIATSTDMITWAKPVVGQVNFGGNTNNNLVVIHADHYAHDLRLIDGVYYILIESNTSALLYSSTDGLDFTNYVGKPIDKFVHETAHGGVTCEPKTLLNIDGVFRVYYSEGHTAQRRSIGYYECATIDGVYVDKGLIPSLTSTDQDVQYYDIQIWESAGKVWACIPLYNKTTEELGPLMLYKSHDSGITWAYHGNILEQSVSGEWDDELIAVGRPLLIDGTWKMIYVGSDTGHNFQPSNLNFGLATL